MNILNYVKKHKSIVGVLLFALCFTCFSSHLTFADDNRLTIGSFNASGEPVQLIIANENGSMASALTTAINQTVSNHSGDPYYSNISGARFLDYLSYLGLDTYLSDSVKSFYDNNLFINVYGYQLSGTYYYKFVFSKSNFVSQPVEWITDSVTGDQYFPSSAIYYDSNVNLTRFVFGPYRDNLTGVYNSELDIFANYSLNSTYNDSPSTTGLYRGRKSLVSLPTFNFRKTYAFSSSYPFDFSSILRNFTTNNNYKFLTLYFEFTESEYLNDNPFRYNYGLNIDCNSGSFSSHPLASSFYFYNRNTVDFTFQVITGVQYGDVYGNVYLQFLHHTDSLAVAFPYSIGSGALAYQNDFIINPTATPTPFPTYEPWDPNNPAGGSTPTPIPSGFGGITPTPIPSVSPPPATVTPINIFYNPVIDNGSDIWGTVKSIFDDFNGFFLGNEFIKFCSSLMNNVFYFDTHFMYFVIPVYICFIMFLIGRFRRK